MYFACGGFLCPRLSVIVPWLIALRARLEPGRMKPVRRLKSRLGPILLSRDPLSLALKVVSTSLALPLDQ
jgi:hypothetical protein